MDQWQGDQGVPSEYWAEPGQRSSLRILLALRQGSDPGGLPADLAALPGLSVSMQEGGGGEILLCLSAEPGEDIDGLLRKVAALLPPGNGVELLETRLVAVGRDQEGEAGGNGPKQWGLLLDAATVFGSGCHPSTRLAAEALHRWLERREDPGALSALDVGTGSGVLALLCGRGGLGATLGLDICPRALAVARRNIEANGLGSRVAVSAASLAELDRSFDLVLANLTPAVLSRLLDQLVQHVKPGGTLILAGFQGRQAEGFARRLAAHGLTVTGSHGLGSWRALSCNL